jgi:hypothetical protein
MHAVVRLNSFDPHLLANAGDDLAEFDAAHAAQPGYLGSLVVELEPGRRLVLNVWESEQHSDAARAALGPVVARLLNPLLVRPSQLLGTGPVISADLPGLGLPS